MDKRNQNVYDDVIELDLIDIFWRLLTQWKAILLFTVVMALIVVFAGYKIDQKNYEKAVEEKSHKEKKTLSASDEKFLNNEFGNYAVEAVEALDEADRVSVMNILRQEKIIKDQREYFSDSIYMNLDSDHLRCLTMGYMVICKDGKDDIYIDMLIKEYRNLFNDKELLENLKQAMGLDVDSLYIRELITVDGDTTISSADKDGLDSFYVNIWIPDGLEETSGIEEAINDAVAKCQKELSGRFSEHSLQLIQTRDYYTADSTILIAQTDMTNRINSLAYTVKTNKDGLQGNQSKAYDIIVNQDEDPDGNSMESFRQEVDGTSVPKSSMKYLVIGAFFGIFLYVFFYIGVTMLSGGYYSASTIPALTGSRLLGTIHLSGKNRRLRLLTESPLIDKIRYKSRGDVDSQTGSVVSDVAAVCRYNGISEVAFIECGLLSEEARKNMSGISKDLISRNITNTCTNITELQNNTDLNVNNVIIVVQKEQTRVKEIRKAVEETSVYHINIIGTLYYD